jgi:hypothetical protein
MTTNITTSLFNGTPACIDSHHPNSIRLTNHITSSHAHNTDITSFAHMDWLVLDVNNSFLPQALRIPLEQRLSLHTPDGGFGSGQFRNAVCRWLFMVGFGSGFGCLSTFLVAGLI